MTTYNDVFFKEKIYDTSQAQRDSWEVNNSTCPQNSNVLSFQFSLGSLQRDKFESALIFLFKRHESLRTKFQYVDNSLKQVVCAYDASMVRVEYFDISADHGTGLISKVFHEKRTELHALDRAPLVRFLFFQRNNGYHFYFLIHHIISDAWSVQILKKELLVCYEALQKGEEPVLPALERQLSDYTKAVIISFDRKKEKFIRFWVSRLGWLSDPGRVSPLIRKQLGFGVFDDAVKDSCLKIITEGKNRSFTWSFGGCGLEDLELIAAGLNCSVNSIVYSSFLFSIYAVFDKEQVLLASPIADRKIPADRLTVGCLLGSIYISKKISDDMQLKDFVREIYIDLLKSTRYLINSHQYIPIDGTDLRLGCDVFVNFSNRHLTQSIAASTARDGFDSEGELYYPLNCMISEYSDALSFKWQFNGRVFSDSEIISLTAYQRSFFLHVSKGADFSISDLRSNVAAGYCQNS